MQPQIKSFALKNYIPLNFFRVSVKAGRFIQFEYELNIHAFSHLYNINTTRKIYKAVKKYDGKIK